MSRLLFATLAFGLFVGAFTACAPPPAPVTIAGTTVPPAPTLTASRVQRGAELYAAHCAACHGANLEGQPNWRQPAPNGARRAPPHDNTGHTWHHTDAVLLLITDQGGQVFDPASAMPGYATVLTPDDQRAILEFIKSRWGQRERDYQWWLTVTQD